MILRKRSGLTMVNTAKMSREKWLELRRHGIGGSDAAAIMGLNPWRSPIAVWAEKLPEGMEDAAPITDEPDSEAMYWGTVLEEPIARRFAQLHPEIKVRRNNHIIYHQAHPFIFANIDRECHMKDGTVCGLEIKTSSQRGESNWEDDAVPIQYVLQVQHYMMVTGWDRFFVAALIGGQSYVEREIKRDDEIISQLEAKETEFWHMVEERKAPEWDGTESAWEIIKALSPNATEGKEIALPTNLIDAIKNWQEMDKQLKVRADETKSLEAARDVWKQQVAAAMGDAELGELDSYRVTYKTTVRKEHTVKASSYRTLRLKELALDA